MTAVPTSGIRRLWAPACENAHGQEIVAMWTVIDDVMLHHGYVPRPGYTSAANCRPITGGKGHSVHSFFDRRRRYTFRSSAPGAPVTIPVAAALDINSDKNPYGPRLVTDMPEAMWRDWLRVRCNNGAQLLVWGGLWTPNHDAMHLQPGCGPADIRTGIDPATLPTTAPAPIPTPTPEDDPMDDLVTCIESRKGEMPNAAMADAWWFVTSSTRAWCPTPRNAEEAHAAKLCQRSAPREVSPNWIMEKRPLHPMDDRLDAAYFDQQRNWPHGGHSIDAMGEILLTDAQENTDKILAAIEADE